MKLDVFKVVPNFLSHTQGGMQSRPSLQATPPEDAWIPNEARVTTDFAEKPHLTELFHTTSMMRQALAARP